MIALALALGQSLPYGYVLLLKIKVKKHKIGDPELLVIYYSRNNHTADKNASTGTALISY
jgi:hypothetical protein